MKKTVILVGELQRRTAAQYLAEQPLGNMVVFSEPTKRRIQEERYHAMCGDIAKQCTFMGKRWDKDDWKRLLVDAFAKAMREIGEPLHHDGRVIPSLDGERVVQLGIQTSGFFVKEASAFIEYLFAYGAAEGVEWSEKVEQPEEATA